jgi:hypothetical protein
MADGGIPPINEVRPDGFEPPTTWFEVRGDKKLGNFDIRN